MDTKEYAKHLVCCWLLLGWFLPSVLAENADSEGDIFKRLLNNYEINIRPNYGGEAVHVSLGVYANSFRVDDKNMEYEMSFYLRESWNDPRLAYDSDTVDTLGLRDGWGIKDLWRPDIFFRSDVSTRVATEEMGHALMRINRTGDIWYVRKLHSRQKCPMNMRKFPFDQQWCPIRFESFGYTTKDMDMSFLAAPLDVDPDVKYTLERYSLTDTRTSDCSQNYTAGTFPCLMLSFCLKREVGYFVLQLYLPSLLLVALSWLSFWVRIRAAAPRLALLLTMILSLLVLSYVTKSDLPKVSYVTGLDVWNMACMLLVLLALVEYLLVYLLDMCLSEEAKASDSEETGQKTSPLNKVSRSFKPPGASRVEIIDRCCRLVFPVVFVIFNIIYWSVITCPDDNDE